MAREYEHQNAALDNLAKERKLLFFIITSFIVLLVFNSIFSFSSLLILLVSAIPGYFLFQLTNYYIENLLVEFDRKSEARARKTNKVVGHPPDRNAFNDMLAETKKSGKKIIDKYLVGFGLEDGEPLWIKDDDLCSHACVFAKTGVGKTLWMESLIFQQMARGRASGCTFIDAKRDSGTLAQIILMALVTGRIEDLIVVDPFDPVHSYNFTQTKQRADVKARKVLRAGLPPQSDQSTTKHYDRLAYDSISRMVRSLEALGLSWSIHDVAVALSAFQFSYPHLKEMLEKINATQALVELGHLANSYSSVKGTLDTSKLTDNLRGISSELHAISRSEMGWIFCTPYTDLDLTEAILRGKIIYFMLPRLEEAESASRMVKLFREDLEISIGEITSSRKYHLEDPHLVVIDEGASTFGPTWANLFELARKGRFSLIFGAQSTGGLTDSQMGLSQSFYERVMANVNLKVMMRVGDNRTAYDMAEWFGKRASTRKSFGSGVSSRATGSSESESLNIAETEEYIVSPEELKHEMSAEKGLAWFDLGDGRIVKGRSFWINSEIPDTWDGREYLMRFKKNQQESLGLGEWVDKQVIAGAEEEHREAAQEQAIQTSPPPKEPETDGAFKLNPDEGKHKVKGAIQSFRVESDSEGNGSEEEIEDQKPSSKTDGKFPKGRLGLKRKT